MLMMRTEISEELSASYLKEATETQAKEVVEVGHGYIYGRNLRAISPFIVCQEDKAN